MPGRAFCTLNETRTSLAHLEYNGVLLAVASWKRSRIWLMTRWLRVLWWGLLWA